MNIFKNKRQENNILIQDDICIKIVSDTIKVSGTVARKIEEIVREELCQVITLKTGYFIARRIVYEVDKKICAVDVDGGSDGKNWLIKVSSNPLEFI